MQSCCVGGVFSASAERILAAVAGATTAGGSRQVVAAVAAAAIRTECAAPLQPTGDAPHALPESAQARAAVLTEGLSAQHALSKTVGRPFHSLGTAIASARHAMEAPAWKDLQRLQRNTGSAKHEWAEFAKISSPSVPDRFDIFGGSDTEQQPAPLGRRLRSHPSNPEQVHVGQGTADALGHEDCQDAIVHVAVNLELAPARALPGLDLEVNGGLPLPLAQVAAVRSPHETCLRKPDDWDDAEDGEWEVETETEMEVVEKEVREGSCSKTCAREEQSDFVSQSEFDQQSQGSTTTKATKEQEIVKWSDTDSEFGYARADFGADDGVTVTVHQTDAIVGGSKSMCVPTNDVVSETAADDAGGPVNDGWADLLRNLVAEGASDQSLAAAWSAAIRGEDIKEYASSSSKDVAKSPEVSKLAVL